MIDLKELTPELEELYGVTESQKIYNDPDFIAIKQEGYGLYSVLSLLSSFYAAPGSYSPELTEHIKNLLQKYRPVAKEILNNRAKILAKAAGLSDYRLGYLTSQYFLLIAIFKDNMGTTCGYRLYDELLDCYNDYTAESVITRLKEHSVRIHNMFIIDDKIYILGGEDAYTHLGTDGSVLEVPFVCLGKKDGEVVTKATSKQKRTPLVFFRRFSSSCLVFMDYEGTLSYFTGSHTSGSGENYAKKLTYTRGNSDFSWVTYSFCKGTNLNAKTIWNSENISMLPTEVNSDYSKISVPYYFNLASSSCLYWSYPSFGFIETRYNSTEPEIIPASELELVPHDIDLLSKSEYSSYDGVEFKPQFQDTLFGNAINLRGKIVLAPRGTSEVYCIKRNAEDGTNICFYPGYSYVGSELSYFRTPFGFRIEDVIISSVQDVQSGICSEKTRKSQENFFEGTLDDFSDEIYGQFRIITGCMAHPNSIKYFPYSIPTVFLRRWQELQAQMSTLAVSGKYIPSMHNATFELKLTSDATPDPFISIPENIHSCILDNFDTASLDIVQVPGDCYFLASDTGMSNLIFLPTSKILNLVIDINTREGMHIQIAGTSVEEILHLSLSTLRHRPNAKPIGIEITAPVKKIAPWALCLGARGGGAQKISLPSTLEVLGAYALYGSFVEYADIKGCEVIGEHAFDGCTNLRRVDFPSNLKIISEKAFGYCGKLKSVELSSCEKLEAEAFLGCEKLSSVTLPENLIEIGNSVFAGCVNLLEIVIPASCKKIGRDAFKDCASLTSLVFSGSPSSIEIDKDAFSSCSYEILKQVEPYIHRSRRKNS